MRLAIVSILLLTGLLFMSLKGEKRFNKDKNRNGLIQMLSRTRKIPVTGIRTDGLYTLIDGPYTPHLKYLDPIIFYDNGIAETYKCGFPDSVTLEHCYSTSTEFKPHNTPFETYGAFEINNGEIDCYSYETFNVTGVRPKRFLTHFIGFMKGMDTISSWHMIPPYPNVNPDFNDNLVDYLTPHTYVFKPFPAQKMVGSKKTWLDDYRK